VALLLLLPLAPAWGQDVTELNPALPIVDGAVQITEAWSIELDQPYNRTQQDGALVFWRPGFTIWLSAWGNENHDSIEQRAEWIVAESAPDDYDIVSGQRGAVFRHAFRRDEETTEGLLQGFYGYTVAADGHLQMAIFFDAEEDLALAKSIVESVRYSGP